MLVIIPHPTEELKLINYQKNLLSLLNTNGNIYYQQHPLWIELDRAFQAEDKHNLKEFSKQLKEIKLFQPEEKNKNIVIPIKYTILFNNSESEIISELPFLYLYKKNSSENISVPLPSLPVTQLKIYRLAIAEKTSSVSAEIQEFIWVKK